MKIAMQGINGSFHHLCGLEMYGEENEFIGSLSYEKVFENVERGIADIGIVAIENSIAGSILQNYDLLMKHDLDIIDEKYYKVHENLLALPGQELEDIKEVYSHPMALKQCKDFLSKYPFTLIEYSDTAAAAEMIKRENRRGIAAVASSLAAEIYGLEILKKNIESDKENYTRFLILSPIQNTHGQKASITCVLKHEKGSLAALLNLVSTEGLNMTKIESRPIPSHDWEYRFYIDVESEKMLTRKYLNNLLKTNCHKYKLLGIY